MKDHIDVKSVGNMKLGTKLLISGGIILAISYFPLLLLMTGNYPPSIMKETFENSGTYSLISSDISPFLTAFTYGGFSLVIAGATHSFWGKQK